MNQPTNMDISTKQYKQQFEQLEQYFSIDPQKFAQITGISKQFINKRLSQESIQINFEDPKEIKLLALLTVFYRFMN